MKFLSLAALALTFAACSNEDNELTQQQAGQSANGEITITATITKDGTMTRALSLDGTDIASTWTVGEKVAILFDYNSARTQRDAVVKSVSAGTATVQFTIPDDLTGTQIATLVYPSTAVNATKTGADVATALATQDGIIANCPEVRTGTGTLNASARTLTVSTSLAAQNTIFMFTIQNLSSSGFAVSEFKVSDASGNVITTVSPTTAPFWVALPVMAAGTYWFNATHGGNPYIAKATLSSATTAGKYYQSTVKMATIGDVIKDDGKFYAAGTSGAVAKICYLGSETAEAANGFNHGLALALSDANGGSTCQWKTSQTDAGHTKQTSSAFTEESGLQYNDVTHNSDAHPAFKAAIANNGTAAPTDCSSWFLASGYQWKQMIGAAGLNNLGLQGNAYYWSSTESSADRAWRYDFRDGTWGGIWSNNDKYFERQVRACLAF